MTGVLKFAAGKGGSGEGGSDQGGMPDWSKVKDAPATRGADCPIDKEDG